MNYYTPNHIIKYEHYDDTKNITFPMHITEFIASKIIKQLGVSVQKVSLGYNNKKECCLIDKFEKDIIKLSDFTSYLETNNSVAQWQSTGNNKFSSRNLELQKQFIRYMKDQNNFAMSQQEYNSHLFKIIAIDLLIANTNRTPYNIGFFKTNNKYQFTPLYNNNSSLWLNNYYEGKTEEKRYIWINKNGNAMTADEIIETYKKDITTYVRKYSFVDVDFEPIFNEVRDTFGDKYNTYLDFLELKYNHNRVKLLKLINYLK